jgi:hypothetical protein
MNLVRTALRYQREGPEQPHDRSRIFDDFLDLKGLYAMPVFGECIWTRRRDGRVIDAWLTPDSAKEYAATHLSGSDRVCRVLPQPARFNQRPVSFVLDVDGDTINWPSEISWVEDDVTVPIIARETVVKAWPNDALVVFRQDVELLSGEIEAVFPLSGRRVTFERKSSAQPDNQLLDVVAFLEERYHALGVPARRESFSWRGVAQAHLIAILRGSAPDAVNTPIILSDHIDTAFEEDAFATSGIRRSAPGADDNAAATATLLLAARTPAGVAHRNDIWLVHLTGTTKARAGATTSRGSAK